MHQSAVSSGKALTNPLCANWPALNGRLTKLANSAKVGRWFHQELVETKTDQKKRVNIGLHFTRWPEHAHHNNFMG